MNYNPRKVTFNLPIDLFFYLQSKENQTAFITEVIKKAKHEEEENLIKKAACEMEECKELWDELKE